MQRNNKKKKNRPWICTHLLLIVFVSNCIFLVSLICLALFMKENTCMATFFCEVFCPRPSCHGTTWKTEVKTAELDSSVALFKTITGTAALVFHHCWDSEGVCRHHYLHALIFASFFSFLLHIFIIDLTHFM